MRTGYLLKTLKKSFSFGDLKEIHIEPSSVPVVVDKDGVACVEYVSQRDRLSSFRVSDFSLRSMDEAGIDLSVPHPVGLVLGDTWKVLSDLSSFEPKNVE